MSMGDLPRKLPGSGLSLGFLARRSAAARANLAPSTGGSDGLAMVGSGSGRSLRLGSRGPIVGLLSGAGPVYTFTQSLDTAAGWAAGRRSGTAIEVNGVAGLAGTRWELWPDRFGKWRFQSVRKGSARGEMVLRLFGPCTPGCNSTTPAYLPGMGLTIFDGSGTAVATGATDATGLFDAGMQPSGTYHLVVSDPRYTTFTFGFSGAASTIGATLGYDESLYTCAPFGCVNPVSRRMTFTVAGTAYPLTYFQSYFQGTYLAGWSGPAGAYGRAQVYVANGNPCLYQAFISGLYSGTTSSVASCEPFKLVFQSFPPVDATMTEATP